MSHLSETQIRFFRDAGYLILPSILPEENIKRMTEVINDHFERKVHPYRVNASGNIRRLDQVLNRDPVFLETLRLPMILAPLQSLLGPNIEVTLHRHNHSTLNSAGDIPFRLHRDIFQWTRSIITAFIYLEDATIENGCTHIVPSTQYLPFAGLPSDGGGGNWADEHEEYRFTSTQAIPVPMPRGGVLLIDSLMFHSVGSNSSNKTRLSTTFAFHSVDDLSGVSSDSNRCLLTGERIYMGSDKKHISGLLKKDVN